MHSNGPSNDEGDESEQAESFDSDPHETSLSVDAILSLLASHQRRSCLHHLVETPNQTTSFEECVSHLVELEAERTGERPGHDQMAATLHHVHVPKLEDAGVLEYDARSQVIRYRGHDRLESWLDRIQEAESELD